MKTFGSKKQLRIGGVDVKGLSTGKTVVVALVSAISVKSAYQKSPPLMGVSHGMSEGLFN